MTLLEGEGGGSCGERTGQAGVPALVVQQRRLLVPMPGEQRLGQDDGVVPGRHPVDDPADQPGERAIEDRYAVRADPPPRRCGEPVDAAGGEGTSQLLLPLREQVYRDVVGAGHGRPARRRTGEAERHQRRHERHRRERGGGEPDRWGTGRRHHGDRAGLVAQQPAEHLRVDGRGHDVRQVENRRSRTTRSWLMARPMAEMVMMPAYMVGTSKLYWAYVIR